MDGCSSARANLRSGYRSERTGSPGGKRPRERPAPERHAIALAGVTEFGFRTAASELDASLRLAAQEDHEISALAGLGAHRLVRDDQGRSRHHPGDAVQYILWNDDPVERCLCT